jgi:hypothetical protein
VVYRHRGPNWRKLNGSMDRQALIEVCEDGTYSIRVAHEGWGVVGDRYLHGEKELPDHDGLDFEGARKQVGVWNEFLGRQDARSVRKYKKKKR